MGKLESTSLRGRNDRSNLIFRYGNQDCFRDLGRVVMPDIFLRGVLVLVFSIYSVAIQAQELTLNQFLKSTLDDPYYASFNKQASIFSKPLSYSLPWVQKIEFRTRNNELLDYRQQYALRLDARNPWQIISNQRYFQGVQVLKSLEQKLLLKELIRERYDLVIEYWMASERAKLAAQQKDIRQQISYAMAQRSGSTNFDADQYLNNELDIISKTADWHEAQFEENLTKTKILQLAGAAAFSMRPEDLIDVDQIRQVVDGKGSTDVRTEIALLKQEIKLSEQEIKTDKLDFDLGFIQAMYAPYKRDQNENPFGISAGVTIPLFNQNRDNIAREKLQNIERQGELEQFQLRETGKATSKAATLELHFIHYQKIDSLITELKKREMNLSTTLASNYNPIVELKYREKLIQFDILKIRIKREILLQFISYLDNSDKLHQRPLVNYLSKNLENLEN
jgi:hypothetical protein